MGDLELASLRRAYQGKLLDESNTPPEPFSLFKEWLEQAIEVQILEPNAFVLSTVDAAGQPHARVVLLKGFQPPYIYFYTNYQSAKADDIVQNPRVAATFWWDVLERQVRMEGIAEKAPAELSDEYFSSRPYESQLSAWASPQSQRITRRELETLWENYLRYFHTNPIPRPPHWGGYQIRVVRVEFWQGRPGRLHDRIVYEETKEGLWEKYRLAP